MYTLIALDLKEALFGSHPIGSQEDVLTSPTSFLSKILPNVYIIAGLILLFLLVFGGFTLITSAGDPEKSQQGQKTITNAIIGFLIIFASYWIIQIIQVLTGIPILTGF
jgi:hypothetical protein